MPEPSTIELERALAALAEEVAYPDTPGITPAVVARLGAERRAGTRPPLPGLALWTRRRLLVAVAIALLALLGIAAAARLTIGALEIRVVPALAPSPTRTPLPDAIGRVVTLEEARQRVRFPILLPPGLPEPEVVRIVRSPFGDRSVLVAWSDPTLPPVEGTPWSLVLVELTGNDEYLYKLVAGTEGVREVEVAGRPGYWFGVPHELVLDTPAGIQTFAVTGNVLVWDSGQGITLRMETALPLAEAVALAETLG